MGEYKASVNWQYSKKNISALISIANDETIDDDDRELAKQLAKKLNEENDNSNKEKVDEIEK